MKMPVSIVIMTKNEEARLPACLAPLGDFDDVFVVDSSSTDRTKNIAETHGAHCINFNWNGSYPKKKQWCFDNLDFKYDWILYVDADEILTPALLAELQNFKAAADCNGYFVKAKPIFLGRILHFGQSNNKIALLRRGMACFPQLDDLDMGEVEGTYQPKVTGKVGKLKQAMLHDCNDLDAWLTRHLRYAKRDAALLTRRRGLMQSVAYESRVRRLQKTILSHLPVRFLFVFFYGYIARLGLLNGRAGFHYAAARAFFYWQRDLLQQDKAK